MQEHHGNVISGASGRQYSYQDERCHPGCYFKTYPSKQGSNQEGKRYQAYELFITKHTDSSVTLVMRKHRKDIVEQRIQSGAAVLYEEYVTILSFAELANRLFNPGCEVYFEEERFPESIKEAMKQAYTSDRTNTEPV